MSDLGKTWAKCLQPGTASCQYPQEVPYPVWIHGKLRNRCRYCRSTLEGLSPRELREQLDAKGSIHDHRKRRQS
jgi:hypothetical protein